jgi:hypothetical protein
MGPASFLKFTTSVAHYIVDDDDHVLMHDHPGHLVKRKSKPRRPCWRLDLLKDKQIADTYRAQIKDLSHVVIDAMDEYQNIDQHQVDKVFSRRCRARQQAFRSVARSVRDAALPHGGHKVCCDRSETQGGV